jgi:hypothetical protein
MLEQPSGIEGAGISFRLGKDTPLARGINQFDYREACRSTVKSASNGSLRLLDSRGGCPHMSILELYYRILSWV